MAKQKKVRVEFLLQQKRNPNEFGCYPVYIQLFYNRRYADFPVRPALYVQDLAQYEQQHPEFFDFEKRQLTSLVRFEEERLADEMTVKGIAKKYNLVHADLYMIVNQYLNNLLFRTVITQQPVHLVEVLNMDNRISVFSILEACKLLFDEFNCQLSPSLKTTFEHYKRYLEACEIPIHFGNMGAKQDWTKHFTVMDWLSGHAQAQLIEQFESDEFKGLAEKVCTWHLDGSLGDKPVNNLNI